jgi:hypothetical protein
MEKWLALMIVFAMHAGRELPYSEENRKAALIRASSGHA